MEIEVTELIKSNFQINKTVLSQFRIEVIKFFSVKEKGGVYTETFFILFYLDTGNWINTVFWNATTRTAS